MQSEPDKLGLAYALWPTAPESCKGDRLGERLSLWFAKSCTTQYFVSCFLLHFAFFLTSQKSFRNFVFGEGKTEGPEIEPRISSMLGKHSTT
jgi:hypothetical protein